MKISDQLILSLAKSIDMNKEKLSKELGISRPTLNKRIDDNSFTEREIAKMKDLKLV